jgi:hypothetical protein
MLDELAAEEKSKGRKEALAEFRLMLGHDCHPSPTQNWHLPN